ncbi:hypothetical protein ILYODFUR_003148 [Ilyodon furcidens]|uniref:Uncharacterized protein n=1 Tax=Ilyodon furcidens TaxID=33524 RepID=A0ABV0TRG7_9TELE
MDVPVRIKIEEGGPGTVRWSDSHAVDAKVKTEPCSIGKPVQTAVEGPSVPPSEASGPSAMNVNKYGATQGPSRPCGIKTPKYDGSGESEVFEVSEACVHPQAVGAPKILWIFYYWDLGHANDDSIRSHF